MAEQRRGGALGIVFTTILIDFIGFSVLIPVLPLYAARLGASAFEVGLLLSIYALAQLLFLPAWGWVSDHFGRRPVLLVSLAGTAFSFGVLALADDLPMLYAARALGGFFAASVGTAQAVVTDVTSARDRARGMGRIGAAFGLGFVVGNALGGELGAVHERLPFVTVAALALVNWIVALFRLPESKPPRGGAPEWGRLARTLVPAPLRLVAAVHERRIALYLYLFLHVITAFSALESMFALFLAERFGLGPREAGHFFAYVGVFIALTQGFLVGRLTARLGEARLVVVGLAATSLGLAAIPLVESYAMFFAVAPLVAIGNGLAFPALTALYSHACEQERAGELLGESQSMLTAGRIAGPVWGGAAFGRIGPGAPFAIAAALMGAAVLFFWVARRSFVADAESDPESPHQP